MRTSITHPLQIGAVCPAPGHGRIGITFCPGKKQAAAMTGRWDRDLALDLDAIVDWNASAVLTLVERHELAQLQVPQLGDAVRERHIDWYHLPIADRGVPDATFEAAWVTVGEGLRARLRDGFDILVHCMGGLGRAGLVASRLLVELGWNREDAVREVRSARPGTIETDGQMEYVFGCDPIGEQQPGTDPAACRDRAMGALVGLAVGDAVGTTLEFRSRDSVPRLTDMVGGGPFQLEPGQWTDDTAMALALADSLIACGDLDTSDLMTRFLAWYEEGAYASTGHCFDIGGTTRTALLRFKQTGDPLAGSTDPMSAGNGSLMRLAPIALRYWHDRPALRTAAAQQSRTTHGAPEAVSACVAFADLLADLIAGTPRSEALAAKGGDRDQDGSGTSTDAIAAILAGSWRGKPRDAIRSSGYVVHSLEAALWAVGRTASFEEAILLAANLGDDADTVAAITGQLAGALYGLSAIPRHWFSRIAMQGRIIGMGTKLLDRTPAAVPRIGIGSDGDEVVIPAGS